MTQRIAILGSTGSIGCNALDVIEHLGPPYRAVALTAHTQADKLLDQIRKHRPTAAALTDDASASPKLHDELKRLGVTIYNGNNSLTDLVRRDDIDLVLAAIVGAAGLPAVLAAVQAGKRVALANKESLVIAGSLLMPEARKRNITLLPVDSEHSAIFQASLAGRASEIHRVILTASGGPFRNATPRQLETATLADALQHPTWRMGNKVTIDSATMFNKALEIIEACWLFNLPPEKVEVVIHPESVIHSMVEFQDGSVIAQLSPPDMRTPIQYALTYPDRKVGIGKRLNLSAPLSFNFQPPDFDRFPALRLAYQAVRAGGTLGAVLNAANEAAVAAFVSGSIRFVEISRLVELTMSDHRLQQTPSLDDLLDADRWARQRVAALIDSRTRIGDPPAASPAETHRKTHKGVNC